MLYSFYIIDNGHPPYVLEYNRGPYPGHPRSLKQAGDKKSVVVWTQRYFGLFVDRLVRESPIWIFEKDGMFEESDCNVKVTEEEAVKACQTWQKAQSYDAAFLEKIK